MKYFVTARDMELFVALDSYGFLSTGQVKKLFYPFQHRSVASRRLCLLQKRKFLRAATGLPKGELVWRLTPKAVKLVGSADVIKSINKNTLGHDVLVSDIRMDLEKHQIGSYWKSSHEVIRLGKYPDNIDKDIIPDWFFTLHGKDRDFTCALEVELHLKSSRRMKRVLKYYSDRAKYDLVWYFAPTMKMGQKLVQDMSRQQSTRDGNWFLFSLIKDLENDLGELKLYHKKGIYRLSDICKIKQAEVSKAMAS